MPTKENLAHMKEIGVHYGRPDIERLGLFVEMPYMNGKGYVSPFQKLKELKGKNLLGEGPKVKDGTQAGYFDKEFKRLFTGECLPGRGRKPPKKPAAGNVSTAPMRPPGGSKQHSCPGDYYGTFSGNIEAFSNKRKPVPKYQKQKLNFVSSPGKKGGPGYADITISKYPAHSYDRYGVKPKYKEYGRRLAGPMVTAHYPQPFFDLNPYFSPKQGPTYIPSRDRKKAFRPPGFLVPTGPGKWPGGCHDGCFDKFPQHKPCKYVSMLDANKPKIPTATFYPHSTAAKTLNTFSVLNLNVDFRVNQESFKNFAPTFTKHLLSTAKA